MTHVDVETSIDIAVPPNVVAAFSANPDNATRWYSNITAVRWATPGPAVLGSRIEFTAHFLGRALTYTYEVIELVPGERFSMSTAEGPFPMTTTYTWAATPTGATVMTLRNSGEPSGFAGFAAPVLSAAMRRANTKDLRRLKAILENSV